MTMILLLLALSHAATVRACPAEAPARVQHVTLAHLQR